MDFKEGYPYLQVLPAARLFDNWLLNRKTIQELCRV